MKNIEKKPNTPFSCSIMYLFFRLHIALQGNEVIVKFAILLTRDNWRLLFSWKISDYNYETNLLNKYALG